MNKEIFWNLIQSAHDQSNGDMDKKCEIIKVAISKLDKSDALKFSELFDEMMDHAFSWSLWGAAYVMNGGCGDDTFSDFRSSLISRGENAFNVGTSSPDSLAEFEFDEDEWFYEGYSYAVAEGVETAVGESANRTTPHPDQPSGEQWEDDPEVFSALFPELWKKFSHIWIAPATSSTISKKPWWKFW